MIKVLFVCHGNVQDNLIKNDNYVELNNLKALNK